VPTAPIEPRDNSHEESLQRRITELEAQLRAATIQTLHGSRASRTISREDTAGNELNSINILGYPFLRDKRVQTGNCLKFDGIRESGSQWIRHLERSGKRFNWDHTSQLATLIDSLEGKTKTWFDTLPLDKQEDLAFLKREISTRFTKRETGASTIVRLANLKMKPDEDVEEFWYHVKKECHLVNERMDLATVVAWFVNGLSPDMKEAVIEQAVEMDEKVVELARRKQCAMRMRKKEASQRTKTPVELILEEEPWKMPPDIKENGKEEVIHHVAKQPVEQVKKETEKMKPQSEIEELKRTVQRIAQKVYGTSNNERQERRPRRGETICYQCHQPGHKKIDCPTLRRSYPQRNEKKRRYSEPVNPEKRKKF
jgi:hypothetical protein